MKFLPIIFCLWLVVVANEFIIVGSDGMASTITPIQIDGLNGTLTDDMQEITNTTAVDETTWYESAAATLGLTSFFKSISKMEYYVSAVSYGFSEWLQNNFFGHSDEAEQIGDALEVVVLILYLLGIIEIISARSMDVTDGK